MPDPALPELRAVARDLRAAAALTIDEVRGRFGDEAADDFRATLEDLGSLTAMAAFGSGDAAQIRAEIAICQATLLRFGAYSVLVIAQAAGRLEARAMPILERAAEIILKVARAVAAGAARGALG